MSKTHIGLCRVDQGLDEKPTSHTVIGQDFSFKQPLVLYFGGRKTTSYDFACRGIRATEKILAPFKINRKKAQFLSVCYKGLSVEQAIAEKLFHRLKKQGSLGKEDQDVLKTLDSSVVAQCPTHLLELYTSYFKALLCQTKEGSDEKLPIDEALKNMRGINIVAYSHGACAVSIFGDILASKLYGLGYTVEEAKKIQKEVFVLTAGSAALLGASKFTTINLVSRHDRKVLEGFLPHTYNSILCHDQKTGDNECAYYQLTENESCFVVDKLCVDTKTLGDAIEHKFKNYLTDNEDKKTPAAMMMTELSLHMMRAALCNSIFNHRSKTFIPLEKTLKMGVLPHVKTTNHPAALRMKSSNRVPWYSALNHLFLLSKSKILQKD